MANHASAEKRIRQNEKRRLRNRHIRQTVRTYVKRVRIAIAEGEKAGAETALRTASKRIAQAVSHGVFHKRTGSRYISRLASQVAAIGK